MKKMASLLVVAALLICMAVPAFAATGINTYEEKPSRMLKPHTLLTALQSVFPMSM